MSSSLGGKTFIYVKSIASVAVLTEFFSYSPHKSCVCFSVNIRAKTGASWGQATGTGGLKSERSYLV